MGREAEALSAALWRSALSIKHFFEKNTQKIKALSIISPLSQLHKAGKHPLLSCFHGQIWGVNWPRKQAAQTERNRLHGHEMPRCLCPHLSLKRQDGPFLAARNCRGS